MSHFEVERDERVGDGNSHEDQLWGAEGGGESVVHDPEEPGFDNREARDTLSESLDDPVDAIPRDPEDEPAPKKKSNLPFYGAVGAFALVALGLVGYKSGLVGGSSRKPIEPSSVASAMASDTPKKPESLIGAAGVSNAATPFLLGGGDAKSGSKFDAEADLLSDKRSAPAAAPAVPAPSVAVAQEAPKPAPAVEPPAAVPVAPPTPPVVAAEKPASAAPSMEVSKVAPAAAPEAAARQTQSDDSQSVPPVAKATPNKPEKAVRVAAAPKKAATPAKVAVRHTPAAKPVRDAEALKPAKGKGACRVEKDPTPDSKEMLAGWKLRGTWPNHGPSQLAWIADESGRLTTVSVGTRVSGARVLSIGGRGEVVHTTAGQILP